MAVDSILNVEFQSSETQFKSADMFIENKFWSCTGYLIREQQMNKNIVHHFGFFKKDRSDVHQKYVHQDSLLNIQNSVKQPLRCETRNKIYVY